MNCLSDGLDDSRSRGGFVEVARAARCFCSSAFLWFILGRNEDYRSGVFDSGKSSAQFQSRNPRQLKIQQQAVENWPFVVIEKRLCRWIDNRLESGCAKQAADRTTNAFVVVHNRHVAVELTVHRLASCSNLNLVIVYCPLGKVSGCAHGPGEGKPLHPQTRDFSGRIARELR